MRQIRNTMAMGLVDNNVSNIVFGARVGEQLSYSNGSYSKLSNFYLTK